MTRHIGLAILLSIVRKLFSRPQGSLSTLYLLLSTEQKKIKAYVQLVLLGFDVTTFTPVAYQRDRLSRPLKVNSS